MADFRFVQGTVSKKWIILSPKREKRPDVARGPQQLCPFCLGREKDEADVFRIGGSEGQPDWQVRVIANKFPFAPVHEIVIHSPDHHKNFSELPLSHVELIFQAYRKRFQAHSKDGQVVIFNNHGEAGGESLPHPHTQIVVVPSEVAIEAPVLEKDEDTHLDEKAVETDFFGIFCPRTSQWPDEVWLIPKNRGRDFGASTDEEIKDVAFALQQLISLMTETHGHEFPFNFYIYPGDDWYIRFMPRVKSIGGFELATGIFVNTKNPEDSIAFIKEHFHNPDLDKISREQKADYAKHA